MTPSLGSLLWFALVLAMIPLGLVLLKRSPWGRQLGGRSLGGARVVGSTAIGPQQRVLTLEVGEGAARRWVLVGVTPQQISHLLTSEAPLHGVEAESTPPPATPAESFPSALARWRPAKN